MKPNFTFLDGDKVLALNRTDVEVGDVGSILDLGDGRQWRVTGLKESTYTVELIPEPVVEAPRTFPKDQPALKTSEPAIASPQPAPAPRTIVPASPTPKAVTKTVVPASKTLAHAHARSQPAKIASKSSRS